MNAVISPFTRNLICLTRKYTAQNTLLEIIYIYHHPCNSFICLTIDLWQSSRLSEMREIRTVSGWHLIGNFRKSKHISQKSADDKYFRYFLNSTGSSWIECLTRLDNRRLLKNTWSSKQQLISSKPLGRHTTTVLHISSVKSV